MWWSSLTAWRASFGEWGGGYGRRRCRYFDQLGFMKKDLGDEVLKGWLVKEGAEFVVVGHVQRSLMAIEPVNEGFEGEAGMEAGGARVAVDVAFGSGGGFGDGAELAGEEGEVSHAVRQTIILGLRSKK